jgi:hypothetical protein
MSIGHMLQNSSGHTLSTNFLQSMQQNREKVCLTFTKNLFTCGQVSSQRGEGTNNRMKGGGVLKKELANADLTACLDRSKIITETQDAESFKVIKELVGQNRKWSSFVETLWQEQAKHVYTLSKVQDSTSEEQKESGTRMFNVGTAQSPDEVLHKVIFPNEALGEQHSQGPEHQEPDEALGEQHSHGPEHQEPDEALGEQHSHSPEHQNQVAQFHEALCEQYCPSVVCVIVLRQISCSVPFCTV